MRFTAPVTCLDVSASHTYLAAGSAEFTITVVEVVDSSKTFTLHGHEAPLLCVKFDPRGELLVSWQSKEMMFKSYIAAIIAMK